MAETPQYLLGNDVIHRDIKTENLFLGLDGKVKLSGFLHVVHSPDNRETARCGTADYFAPEMVREVPYSRAIDLWALGVLTYEFLTAEAPFKDIPFRTMERIAKGNMKPLPETVTKEAKDFILSV